MIQAKHIQQLQPSYIREILSAATTDGVISLAGGLPAAELFPRILLEQAMTSVADQQHVFQYGETQGYAPLLKHFRSAYSLDESQDVLVTTGSQQGLDLIARAYINPGEGVVMEAPSYLGALQVFTVAQARIETLPQTLEGPDLNALESLFASGAINYSMQCLTSTVQRGFAGLYVLAKKSPNYATNLTLPSLKMHLIVNSGLVEKHSL